MRKAIVRRGEVQYVDLTEEDGADLAVHQAEDAANSAAMLRRSINEERDRRIAAGFVFAGHLFQFGTEDKARINGAATLASLAVLNGALSGDLRWHGGDADFAWITADNSLVTMDAPMVIAFGKAAAAWESAHIFAARALKDADPSPADFTIDGYWPAV